MLLLNGRNPKVGLGFAREKHSIINGSTRSERNREETKRRKIYKYTKKREDGECEVEGKNPGYRERERKRECLSESGSLER